MSCTRDEKDILRATKCRVQYPARNRGQFQPSATIERKDGEDEGLQGRGDKRRMKFHSRLLLPIAAEKVTACEKKMG